MGKATYIFYIKNILQDIKPKDSTYVSFRSKKLPACDIKHLISFSAECKLSPNVDVGSVWQDVGVKSCPKSRGSRTFIRMKFFKIAQKVATHLGYFCDFLSPKRPIWSHCVGAAKNVSQNCLFFQSIFHCFLKNGPTPTSYSVYFHSFQTNNTIFTTNQ